jgi:hypothetical protein
VKHSTIEIVANEMMILGERRDSSHPQTGETPIAEELDDEYPF